MQLPGTPATYAVRAYLRDLGLRWDPAGHRWHGTTTTDRVRELRERLGLEVRVFGDLEAPPPPKGPAAPKPASPARPAPDPAPIAVPICAPVRRPHDGSRTRVEARVAFPSLEEDEFPTPTRRFTVWETTSGLPDDCREEDERAAEWRLRDLRGRVKVARAVVSRMPELAETLAGDWKMAARFYARSGVTEKMFRHGVPGIPGKDEVGPTGSKSVNPSRGDGRASRKAGIASRTPLTCSTGDRLTRGIALTADTSSMGSPCLFQSPG